MRTNAAVIATITLTFLAAACGKKDSYGNGASTGATAAPAMGGTAAAAAGASASAGSAALTDPNIVYILHQANASDSTRGKLAETKGTSADVKAFGKMMVGEHHALNQEGDALAKKLNVTPEAPAGDQSEAQAKQEMDSLNATPKGKAWDKAYIDYEVTYHEAVIATATKALGVTQNAELKALIQKAAPVLQKHLDRAKEIQSKLGS